MNKNGFLQNRKAIVAIGLSLVLLVGACEEAATATPTLEPFLFRVQTAVAGTVTADAALPSPTPAPTSLPTATVYVIPTQVPTATSYTSYLPYSTAYGCYDAGYLKDETIPDGTALAPGQTFVKTWKVENTGSCDWRSDFQLVFVWGVDMNGSDTEIGQKVTVGKKADVSVELTAPKHEGWYRGYWNLADKYGDTFGDVLYVQIRVSNSAATSTPSSTATPTVMTNTPTSTPTATDTPSPTP